jgi:hypothetical protein
MLATSGPCHMRNPAPVLRADGRTTARWDEWRAAAILSEGHPSTSALPTPVVGQPDRCRDRSPGSRHGRLPSNLAFVDHQDAIAHRSARPCRMKSG